LKPRTSIPQEEVQVPRPYHVFKTNPQTSEPELASTSKTLGFGFEDLNYIAQEEHMSPGDIIYFPDTDWFWLLLKGVSKQRVFDLDRRRGFDVQVPWKDLNVCFETDDIVFGQQWGPVLANQLRSMTR
jgi:hypothetical protein